MFASFQRLANMTQDDTLLVMLCSGGSLFLLFAATQLLDVIRGV
jgi:hypothetical protein